MNVPILKIIVSKDQFSAVNKIIPAHEFPIFGYQIGVLKI